MSARGKGRRRNRGNNEAAEDTSTAKKYKSFSRRNWDEVMEMLGISKIRKDSRVIPQLSTPDISEHYDRILDTWRRRERSRGFPGTNEVDSERYVDDLLYCVIDDFHDILQIRSQYGKVNDDETGGYLDIAVYAETPSKLPVLYVVEAKKYDMNQGRAQLYPQLRLCYRANLKRKWKHPIYGVVTRANEWIFVRYDGRKWRESRSMLVADVQDENGIKAVIDATYSIIATQAAIVKPLVEKYKEEEEIEEEMESEEGIQT